MSASRHYFFKGLTMKSNTLVITIIIIILISEGIVDILKPCVLKLWLSSYLPQCYLNDQWVVNENVWVENIKDALGINIVVIIVLKVVMIR